jgi:hypothetical protein
MEATGSLKRTADVIPTSHIPGGVSWGEGAWGPVGRQQHEPCGYSLTLPATNAKQVPVDKQVVGKQLAVPTTITEQ